MCRREESSRHALSRACKAEYRSWGDFRKAELVAWENVDGVCEYFRAGWAFLIYGNFRSFSFRVPISVILYGFTQYRDQVR